MDNDDLEQKLLTLLRSPDYIPLPLPEISEQLKLNKKESKRLRRILLGLLDEGTVAKVKQQRYCFSRDADLISGKISFRNNGSAYLKAENMDIEVSILSEETGLALHGDYVLARINRDRPRVRFKKGGRREVIDDDRTYGHVVRILRREQNHIVGTLLRARNVFHVVPDDPRITRNILVPDPSRSSLSPRPRPNDKVIVKLTHWEQRHLNPEGEITEVLGRTHTPSAEFKAILHKFKLDTEFPDRVMKEVANIPNSVTNKDIGNRVDCRKLFTFTIDPDDAKDFDDAISIETLDNNATRIGIHIADVAYYVRPGTVLDREARRRGNSTYLVGRVIPMLPHELSNGICSLVENQDRLTKSVFINVSPNGKILSHEFANTVIRSNKRLTYRQAYAFMTENNYDKIRSLPMPPSHQTGSIGRPLADLSNKEMKQLMDGIRKLWGVAERVRKNRIKGGSLDFDMPEVKIFVNRQGFADRIEKIFNDESHQLIEEYMLIANEAVCRSLFEAAIPVISRVHDKPDEDRLNELRDQLLSYGVQVGDLTNRKEVNRMLERIKQHPQGYTLKISFLRSLRAACYRVEDHGHYGLNKTFYTHFTSPIRRYSDLSTHRIFDSWLQKQRAPSAPRRKVAQYTESALSTLASHLTETERNSTEAERESVKIKLLEFFEREAKKKERTIFKAIITDVRNHGMFIELSDSMAFGLIRMSSMQDDIYNLSVDRTKIVGRRRRREYEIGQEVKVTVERVDRFKRHIDFRLSNMTE